MIQVGDLVRYGDEPSALMRVTGVASRRIYGRAFHSYGTCTSRTPEDCRTPSDEDRARWAEAHDESDKWIRGKWR